MSSRDSIKAVSFLPLATFFTNIAFIKDAVTVVLVVKDLVKIPFVERYQRFSKEWNQVVRIRPVKRKHLKKRQMSKSL